MTNYQLRKEFFQRVEEDTNSLEQGYINPSEYARCMRVHIENYAYVFRVKDIKPKKQAYSNQLKYELDGIKKRLDKLEKQLSQR